MKIGPLVLVVSALPFLAPLAALPAAAQDPAVAQQQAAGQRQVAALIARHPKGGKELAAEIATLIESQTSPADMSAMADAIIAAAAGEGPDVVSALAAGLAQGAAVLAQTDPAAAKAIQSIVAASGNNAFTAGFSVAYSVAVATASSVPAQAASLPGYTTAVWNTTLVSPN